jgi:hypothetical protein
MQSAVEPVKLQFDHLGGSAFCDSCRVIQRPQSGMTFLRIVIPLYLFV